MEKEAPMAEAKLFDIHRDRYPNKRSDVFRSLQTYRCWVCGALTNQVVMGGWPGYGVRVICPNSAECWHHVLEHKLNWLKRPHPAAYKEALAAEIEVFRCKYANQVKNDLEGEPDLSQFYGVTNTLSWRRGSGCRHGFLPTQDDFEEDNIEKAKATVQKLKELGPCAEFEQLIAAEEPFVKTRVRQFFYGPNAHALFFPDDPYGPGLNDSDPDQRDLALRLVQQAQKINQKILGDANLLRLTRQYLLLTD